MLFADDLGYGELGRQARLAAHAAPLAALTVDPPPGLSTTLCPWPGCAGDLSVYGHPTIRTPNLDAWANDGMRFTQVCLP